MTRPEVSLGGELTFEPGWVGDPGIVIECPRGTPYIQEGPAISLAPHWGVGLMVL